MLGGVTRTPLEKHEGDGDTVPCSFFSFSIGLDSQRITFDLQKYKSVLITSHDLPFRDLRKSLFNFSGETIEKTIKNLLTTFSNIDFIVLSKG